MLRGKFIAIQAFLKKEEKSQIENLTHHLNELEEQTKPKVSRRKEIIKIREEINKIEIKKNNRKINKTKSWFFEKVNKLTNLLLDSPRGDKKTKQTKSEMKKEKS